MSEQAPSSSHEECSSDTYSSTPASPNDLNPTPPSIENDLESEPLQDNSTLPILCLNSVRLPIGFESRLSLPTEDANRRMINHLKTYIYLCVSATFFNSMGCANARQHTGEGKQSASSKPNGRNTSQGAPKQREGGAGKKHLRSNIDDDEFHDQRDEQDRKRRRLRSPYDGDNEATCRKLACPYFKHDPSRYGSRGSCSGPGWSNVHRMKCVFFKGLWLFPKC